MLTKKKLLIASLAAMFSIGAVAATPGTDNSAGMDNRDEKPRCTIWQPGCAHH